MNHTVHTTGPAEAQDGRSTRHDARRRQLMDEAIEYVLSHGLSDLSIRPMAEALGITHRTLLHHFGSKEEMVERVLAEIRLRQLQQLRKRAQLKRQDVLTMLDESWAQVSSPERLPFWRAFLEIFAVAAKSPERHAEFLSGIVSAWLPQWTTALIALGLPAARAEALATLVHDACRGFLIDLLATNDHARVSRAYQLLRSLLQQQIEAGGKPASR